MMALPMDPGRKEFFLRMPRLFLDLAMTLIKHCSPLPAALLPLRP